MDGALTLDSLPSAEGLFVLRRSLVTLTALTLSATLAGVAAGAEEDSYYPSKGDPGIDVRSYDLDLGWKPGKKRLIGRAEIRVAAVGDAASLSLDLHKAMKVSSVRVAGVAAPYSHRGKTLTVQTPAVDGAVYDLSVAYRGRPAP